MTRATELVKARNLSGVLVVMKPRRKFVAGDFTLVSTGIYKTTFALGRVVAFGRADPSTSPLPSLTSFTEAASSSVSAGEFYYDTSTTELYIGISAGNLSSNFLVGTYEIYVSTEGMHWYRIPTDTSSTVVYFEQSVITEPTITASVSDNLFGLIPIQTTSITLSNAKGFFNNHVYESSFRQCDIDVYHWVGEVSTTNIKKVLNAIGGNVSFKDETVSFSLRDRLDLLDQIRPATLYTKTTFANLDDNFVNKPIRDVFGVVRGFVPVNVDFNNQSPSITNNRFWMCVNDTDNFNSIVARLAVTNGSATINRTYMSSVEGLTRGDTCIFHHVNSNPLDGYEYKIITAVNQAGSYIEHENLLNPFVAGDEVYRSWVAAVEVTREDGQRVVAKFGRDYRESINYLSSGVSGFEFMDTFESGLSMNTINPNQQVVAKIYGTKELPTISASSFGAVETTNDSTDDGATNTLTHPVVLIYKILKEIIPEASIDTASFQALYTSIGDSINCGFAVPRNAQDELQSYKSILSQILESAMLRLFINTDGKWQLAATGPLPAVDETLDDSDIARTIEFNYSYDDVYSSIELEYKVGELGETDIEIDAAYDKQTVIKESPQAKYLHGASKVRTISTVLHNEPSAELIAQRYAYALGDRQGQVELGTKNRVFDSNIDDNIEIERTRMPGFEYDANQERAREGRLIQIKKNLRTVDLIIDDQKGIEDNSGSW